MCVAHVGNAQNIKEQVQKEINAVTAKMKTMKCDFIQTKHIKILNDKLVSKGQMFYQQSNKLRWEYLTPYEYTFILNGNNVLLKNNKKSSVIDVRQNKVFKEIARIMMNSVVGNCISDSKDFSSSIISESNCWVVTLLPQKKDLKQMFPKIVLYFNHKQEFVTKVILFEKNGDKTIIELINVQVNKGINASVFSVN